VVVFVCETGKGALMKSFVLMAAMLGGLGCLIYQFSFWSVIGVVYLAALALVVLIAFVSRTTNKDLIKSRAADSQNL
jgi:fatty acid desaturase